MTTDIVCRHCRGSCVTGYTCVVADSQSRGSWVMRNNSLNPKYCLCSPRQNEARTVDSRCPSHLSCQSQKSPGKPAERAERYFHKPTVLPDPQWSASELWHSVYRNYAPLKRSVFGSPCIVLYRVNTRGVQKVRRPTQLTTRYAHHILSLFNIDTCNWNAFGPAFLQSSDPVVEELLFLVFQPVVCRADNVLVIRKLCVFSWILSV